VETDLIKGTILKIIKEKLKKPLPVYAANVAAVKMSECFLLHTNLNDARALSHLHLLLCTD
jgi:hypothetical protein